MRLSFKSKSDKIKKEIIGNRLIYFVLFLILVLSLFVRVYRTEDLLRFYYDQGRDALVVWRLFNEGKLFLVGPVTGLAGIFLGPFYYYLIAPFYLIGGGSPVGPAVFLAVASTLAVLMLYILGWKFHSRAAGIIAAAIGAFSYYLILASRWLANPTPLLLVSLLLLWSMWEIANGAGKKWWLVVALAAGLSLQFEAANAVFFLPMILIFAVWQRKRLPGKMMLLISLGVFFLTLLPQIAFNFRHENILFNNFRKVLFEEQSFTISFWEVLPERLNFFWSVFHSKINPGWRTFSVIFFLISATAILTERRKLWKNHSLPILTLFILTPALGLLVFQGNYGNIYDYYLTGVYLPFVLLFSIGLSEVRKRAGGVFVVLFFFAVFLFENGVLTKNYLIAGVDGPTHISLGNQLQAVDWVFEDAKGRGNFNVDVYVPPVIPHAYDYLFLWQGKSRCGGNLCGLKQDEQLSILYTLYEQDPPHPERLEAWLERQKGIGEVEEEESFGGITVQRRKRI